jgi:hypothetical protein
MKKITSCLFLILWAVILFYTSCSNPSAKLEMRLARDPIVLSGHKENYSNAVIISETNGVGGHVTAVELAWMNQEEDGVIAYLKNLGVKPSPTSPPEEDIVFKTKNHPGKRFQAFESWQVEDTSYIQYRYGKVKVTLKGRDDNGHDFNFQKEWYIYYE